jgi:octaprenyl-diphosphate synthase
LFQRGDDLLDFDIRNDEGKAILGDLKSGYLNSFAAFLSREFSETEKDQLKHCQTLEQVKDLVGQEKFVDQVREFDEMNQQAIDLYLHHAESLETMLKPNERGLVSDLVALPTLLYFRK